MRRRISVLFLFFASFCASAQNSFDKDIEFVKHLEFIEAFQEGDIFLNRMRMEYSDAGYLDMISCYQGKFLYYQKDRAKAIGFFEQVSPANNQLWVASRFYGGLQYAYLNDFLSAEDMIAKPKELVGVEEELQQYELAALSLLKRDYTYYEYLRGTWTGQYYQLKDHQEILDRTYDDIVARKEISPLVAGVMSAVVPGAGKFYAGRYGQGTMALLTCGIMGLQTYESYRKAGVKSPGFIIFGSLFSAFYVANIWGSVVSVRVDKESFNESKNETILLHMHIPIRLLLQ